MKTTKLLLLSKHYNKKCVCWTKKYKKTAFSRVIFGGECRATANSLMQAYTIKTCERSK